MTALIIAAGYATLSVLTAAAWAACTAPHRRAQGTRRDYEIVG